MPTFFEGLHGERRTLSVARDITERNAWKTRESGQANSDCTRLLTGLQYPVRDQQESRGNLLEQGAGGRGIEAHDADTKNAWKAFYESRRPLLVDLLVDEPDDVRMVRGNTADLTVC